MIPSYSLAPVFGISISEQRKIYFNHRNTLISLLSNTLHVHRPASGNWRGITFTTVRGTNHQSALRFVPGFDISQETPQYAIFWVTAQGHTVHFNDIPAL